MKRGMHNHMCRSRKKVFKSIVNKIKADSPKLISYVETHQAAHGLIDLVGAMAGLDSNGFPFALMRFDAIELHNSIE